MSHCQTFSGGTRTPLVIDQVEDVRRRGLRMRVAVASVE